MPDMPEPSSFVLAAMAIVSGCGSRHHRAAEQCTRGV